MSTTAAPHPLLERLAALQAAEPRLRARDAAAKLGVTEAQLVAARVSTGEARVLRGPWGDLIKRLPEIGHVMCLARNEAVVHERHGKYETVEIFPPMGKAPPMGQVVGPDIDLRIFLAPWGSGFALAEEIKDGTRHSLQFFDKQGVAIQKIYPQDDADMAAYEKIVQDFLAEEQSPELSVEPEPEKTADPDDASVDVEAFRRDWDAMQDTHQFFFMLRKHKVGREQALRLAGEERARPVAAAAPRTLLEAASKSGQEIMIFVGNRGIIQIHTGPVKNIKPMGPWINVLDPEFNLHLREDLVARAWVVKKATKDGTVTSMEIYDGAGENIALFFGKRKPGQPEPEGWREIVNSLA